MPPFPPIHVRRASPRPHPKHTPSPASPPPHPLPVFCYSAGGVGIGEHALSHLLALDLGGVGGGGGAALTMIPLAAGAAVASIVVKEALYRATEKVGNDIHSPLLIANAWHHRSDAFSSVVALVGIGGSAMGMPWVDPLAGVLVSGMIVKMGGQIGWEAVRDLTDRQTDTDLRARIEAIGEVRYNSISSLSVCGTRFTIKTPNTSVQVYTTYRCRSELDVGIGS